MFILKLISIRKNHAALAQGWLVLAAIVYFVVFRLVAKQVGGVSDDSGRFEGRVSPSFVIEFRAGRILIGQLKLLLQFVFESFCNRRASSEVHKQSQ